MAQLNPIRYSHVAKLDRSSNRLSCRYARTNVSCTTSSASSGLPVIRYARRYTPRVWRSTSTRKASSSPPFAFAMAATSSECICFIRRGARGPVRSLASTNIDVDDRVVVSAVRSARKCPDTRPDDSILACYPRCDVEAPDNRVSRMRIMRLPGGRQRRPLLSLRTTQPRTLGLFQGRSSAWPRHGVRDVRHGRVHRCLCPDVAVLWP